MRHLGMHRRSIAGIFVAISFAGSVALDAQSVGMAFEGDGSKVLVFDADADVPLGTVEIPGLGSRCGDVVITPDLTLGFVSNFTNQIYVIDLTSSPPTLMGSVVISTVAEDLAITPDGAFVLATDGNVDRPVVVVDVATLTQVSALSLGVAPISVAAGSGGNVLITTIDGTVRRLLLGQNGVLTATGESLATPVANNVVIAPDGTTGVLITRNDGGLGSFSVPDLSPLDGVALPGDFPFGTSLAFHPRGDRIFARNTGDMVIHAFGYDTATGAISSPQFSIPTGIIANCFGVEQLAVHPDGSKLYVTDSDSLDVFDANTGAFITTVDDLDLGMSVYVQTLAECFLVIGGGIGDDTFGAGGHIWSTQVEGIMQTYPVSLTSYPSFELPIPRYLQRRLRRTMDVPQKKSLRRALVPVGEFGVQVVMWNPTVFPTNAEQYTQPLRATLWSDGSVTSRSLGTRDGMRIRMETYTAHGTRYVRFPFSIDGF
jgi:hypothetical protein